MIKKSLTALTIMSFSISFYTPLFAENIDAKEVFRKKCKICHHITNRKKIGPGMAGTKKKYTKEWMKKWLAAPQEVWDAGDPQVEELKKRLNKVGRPMAGMSYKKLNIKNPTPDEIDALIEFLWTL